MNEYFTRVRRRALRCGYGRFRGLVSKATYDFVTATIKQFGKPTEPITINTKE